MLILPWGLENIYGSQKGFTVLVLPGMPESIVYDDSGFITMQSMVLFREYCT
jgi:hypothetical protein